MLVLLVQSCMRITTTKINNKKKYDEHSCLRHYHSHVVLACPCVSACVYTPSVNRQTVVSAYHASVLHILLMTFYTAAVSSSHERRDSITRIFSHNQSHKRMTTTTLTSPDFVRSSVESRAVRCKKSLAAGLVTRRLLCAAAH